MAFIKLPTESDMMVLGQSWAKSFRPGSVVFLSGDLGAGKTTLVRAILQGMGCQGPVKSPTYTLVESYSVGDTMIYHFDLYRIKTAEELELIGMRDMFGPHSICFIEWPDRGDGFLPDPDFSIDIHHAGNGREIELIENGKYSIIS
ncbi:MAG: tRNA (adenosine(37)-N6)-threonylcarbamoyltransferase complex ATPase subunit type 1 TsaE [Gammaproteobacteria bacterium]|nr:tRNA (adenosine(37)-N6)-threonylcarbamoyltransferase complex ATPase subunit type 1 TsaE [Gammaproteobacteria bacterium]